jgi:predicted transcriptional regulator
MNIKNIANAMGIPESTLRSNIKQANTFKESLKRATKMTATKTTQFRAPTMEKLEMTPTQWMEHKYQHAIPLSTIIEA